MMCLISFYIPQSQASFSTSLSHLLFNYSPFFFNLDLNTFLLWCLKTKVGFKLVQASNYGEKCASLCVWSLFCILAHCTLILNSYIVKYKCGIDTNFHFYMKTYKNIISLSEKNIHFLPIVRTKSLLKSPNDKRLDSSLSINIMLGSVIFPVSWCCKIIFVL